MRYNFKLKFHYSRPSVGCQSRPGKPIHPIPIFLAGLFILTTCFAVSRPALAKGCDDVKFIFARGSGEKLGDVSVTAWRESITSALQKSTLQYSFYELGTNVQGGYRYPAVSVSDSLGGFVNLLGAYVSRGEFFDFGKSVVQGSNELQSYIKTMSAACPHTQFVLGGYSQGAMVLSRTLGQLNPNRIIYVATFGDPKLYLPEGKGAIPPACLGRSYPEYRVHVPDCRAYEGVLGSYRPYQPTGYEDKLGIWCNEKDVMCSSGASVDDHTSYTTGGLYASAARKIKTRIKAAFPNAFTGSSLKPWASATHNVAFLLDTTVSMANYLKYQRQATEDLAGQVIDDSGEVAFIDFRDLDDPYTPQALCDFGCTKEEMQAALKFLPTNGGGDDPESVLSALLYAMNHLDWQAGATKSIVILTDNKYLSPDRDGTTLSQVVQRSLELDPVNVYVMTRKYYHSVYTDLAAQTNGAVIDFETSDRWAQLSDALLYRPEATLNAPEFSGLLGDEFYFDASDSQSSDDDNLRFDWDLDGDGVFEIQDGPASLTHIYDQTFSGYIQVKVTDASGRFSTMSAKLTVSASLPRLPEIFQASATELDVNTYEIQYETNAERVLVSVNDTPAGYLDDTAQSFTLTDIKSPTTLRLTPYTSAIGRGEGITLALGQDLPEEPEPEPEPEPIISPIVPSVSSQSPAANAPTPTDTTKATIPKAPNTGVPKSDPVTSGD